MAKKKVDPQDKEYEILLGHVREVMKTKSGKEFVWWILDESNIYGNIFTGNSHTYFLEGKRALGLDIIGLIQDMDKTAYARLLLDKQITKEDDDG